MREAVAAEAVERIGIDRDVDHRWALVGDRGFYCRADVGERFGPEALRTVEVSELIEGRARDVGADVAAIEEVTLVRLLCPPARVVHHDRGGVDAVIDRSRQLRNRHAEAAITQKTHDRPFRAGELGPESGREREPNESEIEGGEEAPRLVVLELIMGLETQGSGIEGDDGVTGQNGAERLEQA